jgi:hypothetical protein
VATTGIMATGPTTHHAAGYGFANG